MVYYGYCEIHKRRMIAGHNFEGVCPQCEEEERQRIIRERDRELIKRRPLFYNRNMKTSSWPHLWVKDVMVKTE